MSIELELQIATDAKTLPHPSQFREWISIALHNRIESGELTIRIVDEEESAELNQQYRHKFGPTNVLAFKSDIDPKLSLALPMIGDIVICAPIVESEAKRENKELLAHWAHIVIHGTLHLLGYDHQTDPETAEMEGLETEILVNLGFPPPYGESITHD